MKSNKQKAKKPVKEIVEISKEDLEELTNQLQESKDREQRSLADYQNLTRRTQDERSRVAKLAARDFVDNMIQPLAHLSLASEQINDAGLNMVVDQLWQVLIDNGLEKIDCLGNSFDLNKMEVVDKGENGDKVIKIVKDGYLLNGEVIQHAKVILD